MIQLAELALSLDFIQVADMAFRQYPAH